MKWKYKIDLTKEFSIADAIDATIEDVNIASKEIAERIKCELVREFPQDKEELTKIALLFESDIANDNEFDSYFDMLYDWADEAKCFITIT
jgi:hypothetical protein